MLKMIKFFKIYNLKTWKKDRFTVIIGGIGVIIAIAIMISIRLLTLVNLNVVQERAEAKAASDLSITPFNNQITTEQSQLLKSLEDKGKIEYTSAVWISSNIYCNNKSNPAIIRFVNKSQYPENSKVKFDKYINGSDELILSNKFAEAHGIVKGDTVEVFNPNTGVREKYKVSEIMKDDGEEAKDMNIFGFAFIDISQLEKFLPNSKDLASKLYLKVNSESDLTDIKQQVEKAFISSQVKTKADVVDEIKASIHTSENQQNILVVFTFIISGIGIAITMLLFLLKRQSDITILKVVGAKNKHINTLMFIETSMFILISNLFGIPLGILSASLLNKKINGEFINILMIKGVLSNILIILGASLLIGIIFTLIPIAVVSKIKCKAILRDEAPNKKTRVKFGTTIMKIVLLLGTIFSIYSKSIVGFIYVFLLFALTFLLFLVTNLSLKLIGKLKFHREKYKILGSKLLSSNSKRISVAVIALTIGCSSIGMVLTIKNSIVPTLVNEMKAKNGYNVLVTVPDNLTKTVESTLNADTKIDNYSIGKRKDVHIIKVNEMDLQKFYSDNKNLRSSKRDLQNLLIQGIKVDKSTVKPVMSEGSYLTESGSTKNPVVIGEGIAKAFNVGVGDKLTLAVEGDKKEEFTVLGIFKEDVIKTYDILTSIDTMNKIGESTSTTYYINTSVEHSKELVLKLNKELTEGNVINIENMFATVNTIIKSQIMMFTYTSILCLLASIFLISNILFIVYYEKIKEFALIKVLGATEAIITKIIIVQNIIIGILAGVLSILLTNLLAFIVSAVFGVECRVITLTVNLLIILLALGIPMISFFIIRPNIKVKRLIELMRAE